MGHVEMYKKMFGVKNFAELVRFVAAAILAIEDESIRNSYCKKFAAAIDDLGDFMAVLDFHGLSSDARQKNARKSASYLKELIDLGDSTDDEKRELLKVLSSELGLDVEESNAQD